MLRRFRFLLAALALTVSVPVAANLVGGDAGPSRIPIPARDFQAVVEDRTGTVVEVDRITYNGEVYVYGKLGVAQVSVQFDDIATVRFEPNEEDGKVVAFVTTTDGQNVRLLVDDDTPCYGQTTFGYYQIEAQDIRKIEIRHP